MAASSGAPAVDASRVAVVFDFDKTIIDCDSDDWVVKSLGAAEIFRGLYRTMPWNALMDRIMSELHAQGRSIEEIADCLKKAPIDPHVITGIKSAHAFGCELRIVSDANLLFIRTILEHHGLIDCFTEINTNPSYVDEDGKLRISPYHDLHSAPHGCPRCPPNMCKGMILERIRAESLGEGKPPTRFIYVGDGYGDYCPTLKLTKEDCVMPRKGFPLWDLIRNDPMLVRAEVHEWSCGGDQQVVLLRLIDGSMAEDGAARLPPVDCKFHSVPVAPPSHEARKALTIPR